MSALKELEKKFQDYLLYGSREISRYIKFNIKVPVEIQLNIYRVAYSSRLLTVLGSNYPMLKKHLKAEKFNRLGAQYIQTYPSTSQSIRWYGDKLVLLLQSAKDYQKFTYLTELAELEWALGLVFDAADSSLLSLAEMSTMPHTDWADMQLIFHPSVRRLNFNWNVMPLWQALMEDELIPDIVFSQKNMPWVVWRNNFISHYARLSTIEAWCVDRMISKASFGDLCEGLCQWMPPEDAVMTATGYLRAWIETGLIADVYNSAP